MLRVLASLFASFGQFGAGLILEQINHRIDLNDKDPQEHVWLAVHGITFVLQIAILLWAARRSLTSAISLFA
jgi:hypothetical protein